MEPADTFEQLVAGRLRERLSREHQGDLFPRIPLPGEDGQRLLRGNCANDLIAAQVAVA